MGPAWGRWAGGPRPSGTGAPLGSRIRGSPGASGDTRLGTGLLGGNLKKPPEGRKSPWAWPLKRGLHLRVPLLSPSSFLLALTLELALAPGCSPPVCHLPRLGCGHRAWKADAWSLWDPLAFTGASSPAALARAWRPDSRRPCPLPGVPKAGPQPPSPALRRGRPHPHLGRPGWGCRDRGMPTSL